MGKSENDNDQILTQTVFMRIAEPVATFFG